MRPSSFLLAMLMFVPTAAAAEPVTLFEGRQIADIVHAGDSSAKLAGEMLARDMARVTGRSPRVLSDVAQCHRLCIVIGASDSTLVRAVAADTGIALDALRGGWERYLRVGAASRGTPDRRYLLIAGSDRRGAVWGVTDLTREIGVSAWEWWADVTPQRVDRLAVDGDRRLSDAPSVQYRGIFLNDEDWGLQPWAAKTFEPELGDIGPKTYAHIFELLWRLKANLIWPAMHDSTKPFYQIPGNADAARAYDIVVGTSHAEPMMRNNVREWNDAKGEFNFFTNRAALVDYWQRRAEEVKGYENIYTVGLRGKHDSGMEGADTPEEARRALTDVFGVQRDILKRTQSRPADRVPQVLTLYKEVLDIYATGLKVPDDVTLVWPEDNYGYINQLPTPAERTRAGGSGVYYHISYWGRPHDYLWLGTTHPALIREQMDRARQAGASKLWVVNVGDIKPAEYLTNYYLDLAFDHRTFAKTPREHLADWARTQFSAEQADAIADVMTIYYDLAFERRPEFMGFSQVEPITPIRISDYVRTGGAEAQARIDRYTQLAAKAEAIAATIPANRRDAFFQLVLYPVRSAANINIRNLKLDLAALAARQGRAIANAYAQDARAAHARITGDTRAYNDQIGGKWRHIMDMAPRRLPVFAEPPYPKIDLARPNLPSAATDSPAAHDRILSLGAVEADAGIPADWERVPGLGSRQNALRSKLTLASIDPGKAKHALTYSFETGAEVDAELRIVALPAHPLTSATRMRIGVQIDDGAMQVLDYETHGRSEEWKQNVLSNSARRSLRLAKLAAGSHRVRIYALDPGFLLDRIDLRLDGSPDYYGAPPRR